MTCEIKELEGLQISATYGGNLTSFSLSLTGISSQIKATATIVGSTSTPTAGDDVAIIIGNTVYRMQVGGYSAKGDGTSADTLTLQLYDTSNRILDNNHIALAEEVPAGTLPSNIFVVGKKYGPLPSDDHTEQGLMTTSPDTKWGDLRHFYEQKTPPCPRSESNEDRMERANQNVKSSTGKVLYDREDFTGVLGDILGVEPTSIPKMDMDFKGSLRDCIVQYINAQGLVGYWDMELEKVMIKTVVPVASGMAKLMAIAQECETISFSETIDFTNTLAKGALGSVTSNFQGEGGGPGNEKSKFLNATRLSPKFKYKKCKDKASNTMTELEFNKDVLKAIQAAVTPKIFAGYAFQSAVNQVPAKSRETLMLMCAQLCDALELEGLNPDGATRKIDLTETEWELLLPETIPPGFSTNSFLADYYEPDADQARVCAPLMSWVELGSIPKNSPKEGYDLAGVVRGASGGKVDINAPQEAGKAKENSPKGWNQNPADDPVKTMGQYSADGGPGAFDRGKILLKWQNYFDSILGPKGFTGDNDILRMYLLAIHKFQNRFYVIKESGKQCETSSVNVKGKSYGYYITSEVQNSPVSFKPMDGYKVVSVNPFVPLGECGCGEIKALAESCALMYLKNGTSLSDVMGLSPDPDSPIEALKEGKSGVAVIDFIKALESDGGAEDEDEDEEKKGKDKQSGLEILFNGNLSNGAPPVRRGVSLEETKTVDGVEVEVPQLSMHLLIADPPEQALQDIPQISFTANAGQVDAGNLGEFQPAETMAGPTVKAVDDMLVDLGSSIGGASPVIAKLLEDAEESSLGLWGVRDTDPAGDVIDLNGNIPVGFFAGANGAAAFKEAPFIPAASLSPPDAKTLRVWFRSQGIQNSINSNPGDFELSSMAPPAQDCWKSKIDFGVSVNAADIGRDNTASGYLSNSSNQGNAYSPTNRFKMAEALDAKLAAVVGTGNSTPSESKSLTYIMTKRSSQGLPLPTMEEGLEAISLSLSGTKTQVTLTVGNSVQMKARAAIADRMVQSPSSLYRPGAAMGNSLFEGASPKFLNFLNGN